MTLKHTLLAASFSLLALPTLASGQSPASVGGPIGDGTNANQQSGVNAAISTGQIGSNSRAISGARSTARATGGAGGQGGAGGRGGSAAGGSVVNNIGNGSGGLLGSQPETVTVRQAPAAIAPPIYGANPCSVGLSGAGSWIASGFGFGAQWESENCARRDMYRMHIAAGNAVAAKGTACLIPEQRQMFREIGDPCPQDLARQRASAPPAAAQVVAMNRATARDPQPSRADCNRLRRLADPTQVQRDYMVNCQ